MYSEDFLTKIHLQNLSHFYLELSKDEGFGAFCSASPFFFARFDLSFGTFPHAVNSASMDI